MERKGVISVRELNLAAKQLIEGGLPLMWVRGEVSNFVSAASGHWYFSLKDEAAQVRCVMFRHKSQYLDFKPANGMQIEVLALASLYEARGDFQLTLERMRPAGLGALYEAFERLKGTLELEGLFDAARKRALPLLPQRVGIITSPQAAALRDVLRTLSIRMPSVPVVLYPVPVQGEGAGLKIAHALTIANQRAECDVLILCRGGGSIEDLWAFNEEVVARAIAASDLPVVSGVGHETDFTIADFVADVRAATPTAAAQIAVPARQDMLLHLQHQRQHLWRASQRQLEQRMQRLDLLHHRLLHPEQQLQQQRVGLQGLERRLKLAYRHTLQQQYWRTESVQRRLRRACPDPAQASTRLETIRHRLATAMRRTLEQEMAGWTALQQQLQLLDPQHVLGRGYSLVRDRAGNILSDSRQLVTGDCLQITFAHGSAGVVVQEKNGAQGE